VKPRELVGKKWGRGNVSTSFVKLLTAFRDPEVTYRKAPAYPVVEGETGIAVGEETGYPRPV